MTFDRTVWIVDDSRAAVEQPFLGIPPFQQREFFSAFDSQMPITSEIQAKKDPGVLARGC
jgi:hypothetical protein